MMKSKSMVWRMLAVLFFTILFWGGGVKAYAEKKAWVKFANGTLTFQYGEKTTLGTDEYWLNERSDNPGWSGKSSDVTAVVFDKTFSEARPTSCYNWFCYFSKLETIDGIENLNTSNVTTMQFMFMGCSSLTSLDVSNFDTSNVTNMWFMFRGCSGLTSLDVSNFDTSKVTSTAHMFYGCSGLTFLDVSNFDTSNVTDMQAMFRGCSNLERILASEKFVTSGVTGSADGADLFTNCTKLVGDGDFVYEANKTDKTYATIDGGYFLDKKYYRPWVKYADGTLTFQYGYKKTLDTDEYLLNEGSSYPEWPADVTTVVFDKTFAQARPTSCYGWFYYCDYLSSIKSIENLNTSNVTNMALMFTDCPCLASLDVSNFDTSNVTNMNYMFSSCSGLTSLDVSNFDTSNVTAMSYLFNGCSGLTSLDVSHFDTSKVTTMSYLFNGCSGLTSLDVSHFDTSKVTTMSYLFNGCSGLTSLDLSNFDTSKVTTMSYLFNGCSGLTSLDLSNFDTSKVTTMSCLFNGCSGLTSLDLSNFETSNVTSMYSMFRGCSGLTSLDLSKFDTSKVTTMSYLFFNCSGLTSLDVSKFNTSNLTNMYCLFFNCSGLTSLDVSKFNTSNLTDMAFLFNGCSGLTSLDLSNFDTSKVTDMYCLFNGCSGLTSLDLSNFDTSKVTNMYCLFNGCSGLTSLDLSNFDTSKVTDMDSMFSGCYKLNAIYWADKFDVDQLSSIDNSNIFKECPATLYCSPKQYDSFKNNSVIASYGNAVKPYVSINKKSEYGTLCVPVGSSLAENSFTGFDKLYQVENADKDKGTITLVQAKSIEPGVPYVYHRDLPENAVMSVITFDVDENASSAVTAPKNENSLLKGTFESMVALGGSYILQTDGNFHPVAADNKTLKVGAYRAYLDLNSTEIGGLDEGFGDAKAYRMVFEDGEATGIDRINGEGFDGSDKGVYDQADQQPKVYFDLMGRKVAAPQKGEIYIVNGKKVVYNK